MAEVTITVSAVINRRYGDFSLNRTTCDEIAARKGGTYDPATGEIAVEGKFILSGKSAAQ